LNIAKKEDTLKKRYTYKLITNLIGAPIGIITQSIIPRGLGPKAYGDFSFLSNFFIQTTSFFDSGTSEGFYSKLSKRPNELSLKKFYWHLLGVFSLTLLVLFILLISIGLKEEIWPDQSIKYIFMGLAYGYLCWYSSIVLKLVDAHAITRKGELIRMSQKIIGLVLVLILYIFDWFTLELFFIYNYFILLYVIIMWILILKKQNIIVFPKIHIDKEARNSYISEFYKYSGPLVVYSLIGMFTGIFDRWLLQEYSGSVSQGYYSLAFRVGKVCFIFTSAMTPLIFREFSIAIGKKDFAEARRLFERYIPMMFAIASYFGLFLCLQAKNVAFLMGGKEFESAALSVALMSLYPIHQTYGQLSGSVFLASDNTKTYRNIGIVSMLLGLPVTYILIAGKENFGLGLGDVGLALKMIIIQFILVNVQLWYNAKYLKISFSKYFIHQLTTIGLFAIIAYFSSYVSKQITGNQIYEFLASGVLYTAGIIILAFIKPSIFSLKKQELVNAIKEFSVVLKSRNHEK
jgi:O-antigen/teichoic acid export membrane protein